MNPAWIGVIGALAGVLLAAAVSFVSDRVRWEREETRLNEDRRRAMHGRRRELAVDLVTTVDELTSRAWSFVDYRSENPKSWRTDPYAQLLGDKIDALLATVNRSYNELRILGIGDDMADAADHLLELTVDAVNATFADEAEDWDMDAFAEAGGRFLDAAHDEFRVTRTFQSAGRPSAAQGQVRVRPSRLPEDPGRF